MISGDIVKSCFDLCTNTAEIEPPSFRWLSLGANLGLARHIRRFPAGTLFKLLTFDPQAGRVIVELGGEKYRTASERIRALSPLELLALEA